MFYCINVFSDNIDYLEEEEVIVIYEHNGEQLHIFDVISKQEIDLSSILSKIAKSSTKKVVFHYTPDDKGIETKKTIFHRYEVLFVKLNGDIQLPVLFKHPLTSPA
jgi:hypothetical protein